MKLGIAVSALAVAVVCSASATARPSELPRGWWKGTFVVEERWDRLENTSLRPRSYRGSATLRVERTSFDSASYELEYVDDALYGPPGPGDDDCQGKLEWRWTSSLARAGPIAVSVRERPGGAAFFVDTRLSVPIDGTTYTCGVAQEKYDAGEMGARFAFLSREPDGASVRRGKATLDSPAFFPNGSKPRPGGVSTSTVTYDLRLVRSTTSLVPAGLTLPDPFRSTTISPIRWRPGTNVTWVGRSVELVDAAGRTIARNGANAGCDLGYVRRSLKNGRKSTTILQTARIRASWANGRLTCAWQIPIRGPVPVAVAAKKNVMVGISPWVVRAGKRYWMVRPAGFQSLPHAITLMPISPGNG